MKLLAAAVRPRSSAFKTQPMLLLLAGVGFVALGVAAYPAFIAVGCLFLLIGYRGLTCPKS